MFFTSLVNAATVVDEVNEDVVVLMPAVEGTWHPKHLVITRQDWDDLFIKFRSKEPEVEQIMHTIMSAKSTAGSAVYEFFTGMDSIRGRYLELVRPVEAELPVEPPPVEGSTVTEPEATEPPIADTEEEATEPPISQERPTEGATAALEDPVPAAADEDYDPLSAAGMLDGAETPSTNSYTPIASAAPAAPCPQPATDGDEYDPLAGEDFYTSDTIPQVLSPAKPVTGNGGGALIDMGSEDDLFNEGPIDTSKGSEDDPFAVMNVATEDTPLSDSSEQKEPDLSDVFEGMPSFEAPLEAGMAFADLRSVLATMPHQPADATEQRDNAEERVGETPTETSEESLMDAEPNLHVPSMTTVEKTSDPATESAQGANSNAETEDTTSTVCSVDPLKASAINGDPIPQECPEAHAECNIAFRTMYSDFCKLFEKHPIERVLYVNGLSAAALLQRISSLSAYIDCEFDCDEMSQPVFLRLICQCYFHAVAHINNDDMDKAVAMASIFSDIIYKR